MINERCAMRGDGSAGDAAVQGCLRVCVFACLRVEKVLLGIRGPWDYMPQQSPTRDCVLPLQELTLGLGEIAIGSQPGRSHAVISCAGPGSSIMVSG